MNVIPEMHLIHFFLSNDNDSSFQRTLEEILLLNYVNATLNHDTLLITNYFMKSKTI